MAQGKGRDHHNLGYSMWLAGGGVKPGLTLGGSDEFGFHATTDKVHVHDLHATLLHLFGLDYQKLVFQRNLQEVSLVDKQPCKVIHSLLA